MWAWLSTNLRSLISSLKVRHEHREFATLVERRNSGNDELLKRGTPEMRLSKKRTPEMRDSLWRWIRMMTSSWEQRLLQRGFFRISGVPRRRGGGRFSQRQILQECRGAVKFMFFFVEKFVISCRAVVPNF